MQNDLLTVQYQAKVKQAGLRNTHAKKKIFEVLRKSKSPLSVQDLVQLIKGAHFVSVYRSIDALQKAGVVKLVPQGFKNLFELSDDFKPHHHHLSCSRCGYTKEVANKNLEDLMDQLSKQAGFRPTEHHFELFGICQSCQVKEAKQDRSL